MKIEKIEKTRLRRKIDRNEITSKLYQSTSIFSISSIYSTYFNLILSEEQ